MSEHAYLKVREENYFRGVLGNMSPNSRVRFGETGDGVWPNYQIERPDGELERFRGSNHKSFHEKWDETFDENKLSEPLTYANVQQNIARCRRYR